MGFCESLLPGLWFRSKRWGVPHCGTRNAWRGPLGHSSSFFPTASKGGGLGTICLWSWSQTWVGRGSHSTVAVVVLAQLQWSSTELAYFSLSTCPGKPACTAHPTFHLLRVLPHLRFNLCPGR